MQEGTAKPGTNAQTKTASTKAGTPASEPGGDLASVKKPCDLLKAADATNLFPTSPENLDANSCQARDAKDVLVRFNLYRDKGLKDITPVNPQAELSDTTVGAHKAKLIKKAVTSTACAVTIEVSAISRVDVVGTGGRTLDVSCDSAMAVAKAIEPNLP
ncbi:hypothetical protein Lesp02_36230 [Lentzea sp. NBRC 105346]|nr:hypothetical protein Lesp02_36230 [Lentzea sp. NBRC 105346]